MLFFNVIFLNVPILWLGSVRLDFNISKTLMTRAKDKRVIQKLPGKCLPLWL